MGAARFKAWVPNATGNLSFSLIGQIVQNELCESVNQAHGGRRTVVAKQRRNTSDNLIFRRWPTPRGLAHSLDFTLVAKTDRARSDTYGVLRGWIFIHAACPAEIGFLDVEDGLSGFAQSLARDALFGVAFRLKRNGELLLRVPPAAQDQKVKYGDQIELPTSESLRPLVAQCFYFLRDITHKHQHHSSRSDTLTTVWPADDESRWIRETLYELYRRVIMLRRQRSPRGQEDAQGILAYVASFEGAIAGPFRDAVAKNAASGFVPVYDKTALKDSLSANLETKRRKRIQKNVVAAVIPAFTAAMLALANSIYGDPDFEKPTGMTGWLTSLAAKPVTTSVAMLASSEWLFPVLAVVGYIWIGTLAGVFQLTEDKVVKGPAQAFASWGRAGAVLGLVLVACAMIGAAVLLFSITPDNVTALFGQASEQ